MDWKAFITDLAIGSKQTITFGEGASTAELDGLETEFNFRLPAQYTGSFSF
jgi:hypothetical protein